VLLRSKKCNFFIKPLCLLCVEFSHVAFSYLVCHMLKVLWLINQYTLKILFHYIDVY
jgi:hypothetical protein